MGSSQKNSEFDLASIEKYKAEIENYKAQLKQEEIRLNRWAVAFREIINLAVVAIRSLILINGGAIIALLAFLGNFVAKEKSISHINAQCPLLLYCLGLSLSVLTILLAYVFQVIELESTWKKIAIWIRIIACLVAFLSLVFFIWGSFSSIKILSSMH